MFSKYSLPEPSLEPTVEKDSLRLRDYSRRGRSGKLHSLSQSDSTKWRFLNDVLKKCNPPYHCHIHATYHDHRLLLVCTNVDVIQAPPLPSSLSPSLSLNGSPEFPTSWQRQIMRKPNLFRFIVPPLRRLRRTEFLIHLLGNSS